MPAAAVVASMPASDVLRDRRLWRLSGVSALLIVPQFTMVVLLVVKGVSAASAALVLSAAQAAGALGRILVGAWSDRVRARMRPLRTIALACAAGSVAVAAAYFGPLPLLVVVLVVVTGTTVCWNGLALTPPCVGLVVGWVSAYCLVAIAPLAAAALLNPVLEPAARREEVLA